VSVKACDYCGSEHEGRGSFCSPSCSIRQKMIEAELYQAPPPEPKVKRCERCDTEVEQGPFCPYCQKVAEGIVNRAEVR
jgi:hypothetical protein